MENSEESFEKAIKEMSLNLKRFLSEGTLVGYDILEFRASKDASGIDFSFLIWAKVLINGELITIGADVKYCIGPKKIEYVSVIYKFASGGYGTVEIKDSMAVDPNKIKNEKGEIGITDSLFKIIKSAISPLCSRSPIPVLQL